MNEYYIWINSNGENSVIFKLLDDLVFEYRGKVIYDFEFEDEYVGLCIEVYKNNCRKLDEVEYVKYRLLGILD
jgi:hypothetical protein